MKSTARIKKQTGRFSVVTHQSESASTEAMSKGRRAIIPHCYNSGTQGEFKRKILLPRNEKLLYWKVFRIYTV